MLTDELLNAADVTTPKQVCRMNRIPFKTANAFFPSSDWQSDFDIHLEIQGA